MRGFLKIADLGVKYQLDCKQSEYKVQSLYAGAVGIKVWEIHNESFEVMSLSFSVVNRCPLVSNLRYMSLNETDKTQVFLLFLLTQVLSGVY